MRLPRAKLHHPATSPSANGNRARETAVVEFGAHLPLMDFGGNPFTLVHLADYTRTASELGFSALSVNDHMVFAVPWLDGPTALAAVIEHSGDMALGTTVSLPVVRGPVPLAKALAAIDRLSGGRLFVAVGPGSSVDDFAAVGVDFDERWARLDESFGVLRAFWSADAAPFAGRFYSSEGIRLERCPRSRAARRSGRGAGAPTPASGGRRAWRTAGWRRPTTRHPPTSARRGTGCRSSSLPTARIRRRTRTRWRPCGSTSPTTTTRPSG